MADLSLFEGVIFEDGYVPVARFDEVVVTTDDTEETNQEPEQVDQIGSIVYEYDAPINHSFPVDDRQEVVATDDTEEINQEPQQVAEMGSIGYEYDAPINHSFPVDDRPVEEVVATDDFKETYWETQQVDGEDLALERGCY